MTNKLPVKSLFMPVFYDDMREEGIRNEINIDPVMKFIRGKKELHPYIENIPGITSLKATKAEDTSAVENDMKALDNTAQEYCERKLEKYLERSWMIWGARADLRARVFIDLYRIRNYLLGIRATTIRKMIPDRYQHNYHAFLNILQYCKDKGISLYIYIPPLRNDIAPPYVPADYVNFKSAVETDCKKSGVYFVNLEQIIPPLYWGKKQGTSFGELEELDFMHFQENGHRIIADTFFRTLINAEH
jgi:hypothetical protein